MDDAHPYALLAEPETGGHIGRQLRNKLVKYFQSKRANGGECRVEYEDQSPVALLLFRKDEDRQRVLAKKLHDIQLGGEVLRMTVRLPGDGDPRQQGDSPSGHVAKTVDPYLDGSAAAADDSGKRASSVKDQTADPVWCSTSAVLENVPRDKNQEYLEMLVENILKNHGPLSYSLEVLPDIGCAVVSFSSGKEKDTFISSCQSNRIFKTKNLCVRPLEVTAKVIVEEIPNDKLDHFLLYLENEGAEIDSVTPKEEEQSAILTFKTAEAVKRITEKKHLIGQTPVKVFPYFESLGAALYGKERPALKLPASFSESIDPPVSTFIRGQRRAQETICGDLAKHFCTVDFQPASALLSPLPALLQQKGVNAKELKEWTQRVKAAFSQTMAGFKTVRFLPLLSVWEECERQIKEAVSNEPVVVVPDKDQGVLSVAGFTDDVLRLEGALDQLLNSISQRVKREEASIIEQLKLSPAIFQILSQDRLQDQMLDQFPDLKIVYKKESEILTLYGLSHEVLAASKRVINGMVELRRRPLDLDRFLFEFLKRGNEQKLTSILFTSNKIDAALEIDDTRVTLLAVSNSTLDKAEEQLGTVLVAQYVDVEDCEVLKTPEWKDLVARLDDPTDDSFRKIEIRTSNSQQIVVSGFNDSVIPVCAQLDDFLHQHAEVEETIRVKFNVIVKYIEEHNRNAWADKVEDKVVVSFGQRQITLSGSRHHVINCRALFEALISSLFHEELKIAKPGAKVFFNDKGAMYVSAALKDTGCLVQLVDEPGSGESDLALGAFQKPVYQLQTSDGIEIAVCNADLCTYTVDAVVNASNRDLNHNGGLSAKLLAAAGPQLQQECDELIARDGHLKPGDCKMTGAGGLLRCKKIIHVFGPSFDRANTQKAVGQLRRAVKGSLELAARHGCLSLALPAISRNLGFPLALCADTIIGAVKDHCDDQYGENTLKKIHLVNNEDIVVEAMETAVKKKFGNHGIRPRQLFGPPKTSQSPHAGHVQSTSPSTQALTNEGLRIILTKGNIQETTSEVVVNTVGQDLALHAGAVSKAIFAAAGNKLQKLVVENKSTGNYGDIIVTSGCKLKSDKVFHAVVPSWDKGPAQKMLIGIVEDCLRRAEDLGKTSITFPAIGSGNLGYPKDLSASIMLDEVLRFSSTRQPKHLATVVIILYPSDTETIQVFTDEFTKRFGPTSGGQAPTKNAVPQGPFMKVFTTAAGVHETKMGNVAIQLATGDITKETTDVIVNSSDESFSLQSGVSKAILNAAGNTVLTECTQLAAQLNKGMIMTQPGNLKCKKILHLSGQTDPAKITQAVKDALLMCAKNLYTSVSFPAIGTGQGKVPADRVADAMFDAVVDVVGQNAAGPLATIRIVIFQPAMMKDFHLSLQKKEHTTDSQEGGGGLWGKIKSLFTFGAAKPQKDEDFVIEGREMEPACFHICGKSQPHVDLAAKWINDLISTEQFEISIKDEAILSLSAADHKRIHDIQMDMCVSIRIEHVKPSALLTIKGMSKDVLKASKEIHDMLKAARDEEELKKRVELAATVAEWQYQPEGLQFQSFDAMTNLHLEQALESEQPDVDVKIHGRVHKVRLPVGPATDGQGGSVQVRRIDKMKDW